LPDDAVPSCGEISLRLTSLHSLLLLLLLFVIPSQSLTDALLRRLTNSFMPHHEPCIVSLYSFNSIKNEL